METAQFTEQQLADLEAGGIRLVNCIMAGGDSAAEFNQIFGEWVVGNGVPFPENMNPGAGWEEKWIAARNRLMVHLCHHGRAHLRKLDNRLLNYHLSDLIELARISNTCARVEQEINDVVMGDPEPEIDADQLAVALSNLRVTE